MQYTQFNMVWFRFTHPWSFMCKWRNARSQVLLRQSLIMLITNQKSNLFCNVDVSKFWFKNIWWEKKNDGFNQKCIQTCFVLFSVLASSDFMHLLNGKFYKLCKWEETNLINFSVCLCFNNVSLLFQTSDRVLCDWHLTGEL